MQFFYELFPVLLFFLAFKFYDIYVATTVGIVASLVQVLVSRGVSGKWDKKQLITFFVFVFFGGMTLYFHNPIFVKWKPTIVFWLFAFVILVSHFFARKPIIQHFMENILKENENIPQRIWRNLNMLWALFLLALGGVNLYIAYYFSDNTWVNFKFYGITSALFLLSIIQALYLMRYLSGTTHAKK